MSITLLLLFFLSLFNILTYSAYGITVTAEAHSQKQPKVMYGMIMESTKPGNQRTYPGLHVVQHTRNSKKASRPIYGGANDIRRPRNRNSANSFSVKSSSLFMAALKHLIFGSLVLVCFF